MDVVALDARDDSGSDIDDDNSMASSYDSDGETEKSRSYNRLYQLIEANDWDAALNCLASIASSGIVQDLYLTEAKLRLGFGRLCYPCSEEVPVPPLKVFQ
jgi:hypothetical protein